MMLLTLFVLSLALRVALVAHYGFDGLYGQDPYAYYQFAEGVRAALLAGDALPPFFWPLGYPLLLAGAFSLFGTSAMVGQAVSLALGAALTPLVYTLARQLGIQVPGALAAAALMTVCGQAMQSSLVIMADVPALFWALLSAVILTRAPGDRRTLFLAAFTLALGGITRWLTLGLAIPWALYTLSGWGWRLRLRETSIALLAAALVIAPQWHYSATTPYPPLEHPWVTGWHPQHFLQRDFTNPDGQFHYVQVNALYYAQPFYDPYYLAPVFTLFLLGGVVTTLRERQRRRLLLLVPWLLLPYLFLSGIPYQNIRFPLIVVPAVVILAGAGLERLLTFRPARVPIPVRTAVFVVVLVAGAAHTASASRTVIDTFVTNQQRDKQTAHWALARIPDGAAVYTFGLTLTLQHYGDTLNVVEIYYETPETLAGRYVRGQADYLLLNLYNIETQWRGREPEAAYRWLADVRGLTEIDRYGYYTLFRVEG